MVVLSPQAQSHTSTEAALEALDIVRARTNALIAPLSGRDLERSHSPLMSPLVWDLGHIAAYEDLWISHRFGGRRLLRPELARVYDAFETPRSERRTMRLLQRRECEEYVRRAVSVRSPRSLMSKRSSPASIRAAISATGPQPGDLVRVAGEQDRERAAEWLRVRRCREW